jgi:hypothetical protein
MVVFVVILLASEEVRSRIHNQWYQNVTDPEGTYLCFSRFCHYYVKPKT